ncbi:MAG: hypothetical protein SOZ95_02855 [Bacilli bacterium]|nr:hypothetical protein [Bacilli bacterium]
MRFVKLDTNDKNYFNNINKIFLEDETSVIVLGNNSYITYHSYIDSVKVGYNPIIEEDKMQQDIKEIENVWSNNTYIDKHRWNYLYKDNDKVIDYLRSLNLKKIYITGELSNILYSYINVYGNDFEVEVIDYDLDIVKKLIDNNEIVLDTCLNGLKLKEILFNKNLISLTKLCENVEYYYFVKKLSKKLDITVFEFPSSDDITSFSLEERKRLDSKIGYIYYLSKYNIDEEITKLLNSIYGESFMTKFCGLENISPGTIIQNGICRLADSNNEFCRTINGKRVTTDKNRDYAFDINFLGPCMIYGVLVDDKNTIPSCLQRIINENNRDYSVNNYGLRAMEFFEQVRIADNINSKLNDKFIFIVSKKENEVLKSMGYNNAISLLELYNSGVLKNYFIDKPAHCNSEANDMMARFIYEKIEKELKTVDSINHTLAIAIPNTKKRNIFGNNRYLNEYLEFLKGLNINTSNNGAILMNCNPFTYGHYKLIDYARKEVNTLIVMVVQEDKSKYSFKDRYEMVKEGCKDFENVVVIPSGKIFGSSMIFPEYFNRSESTDVSLDLSIDQEIFTQYIAPVLNIKKRFVGQEQNDYITREYNKELKRNLPLYGIELIEIPRFRNINGDEISAKAVRRAVEENDDELLEILVPESTLRLIKTRKMK